MTTEQVHVAIESLVVEIRHKLDEISRLASRITDPPPADQEEPDDERRHA